MLFVLVHSKEGVLLQWTLDSLILLGWNCVGLVAILLWTGTTSFVMFYTLKFFKMLRVEPNMEFKGGPI